MISQTGRQTGYPSVDKPWLRYYKTDFDFDGLKDSVYEFFMKQDLPLETVAIEYFGRRIKYQELIEEIESVTQFLCSLGIEKGDVVTLCMPSTPEVYYFFFALNRLGAIANLLDPRANIEFIENNLVETKSKILIYVDVAWEEIRSIVSNSTLLTIINIPISASFPRVLKMIYNLKNRKIMKAALKSGHLIWNGKCEVTKREEISTQTKPDDVAAIVYTSGTTEVPKGALMTNKNILSQVMQNKLSDFEWNRYDRFLEIMPPFIAYGLVCGIVVPLFIGMHIIVIPKFETEQFADLIIKHQPNHIMGVPSMMEDLTHNKKLSSFNLSFLKTVSVGGDKISIASEERINEFLNAHNCKSKLVKGYGMTEMSANAVFTKDAECNLDGSVGVPIIGNNVKIIDSNGNELKYGQKGEICLSGPTLIQGYFNKKELTDQVFLVENGERWIHSGDIGYMNEDGVLFVDGRIKRMIIRHDGFKVIPRLIEDVICMDESVKECAVVGINDKEHGQGQLPVAWVVLNDESNISSIGERLLQRCHLSLPEYEQPYSIVFTSELPLTSVGKVNYNELENRLQNPNGNV